MRSSRFLLAALVVALPVAVASAAPEPTRPATSFRAVLRSAQGSESVAWRDDGSLAVRLLSGEPLLGGVVERRGAVYFRFSARSPQSLLTGQFAARPDGSSVVEQLRGPSDFVLAEARRGQLKLRPAKVGGDPAWRAKLFLPRNDCAALPSGSVELWLRRADFLPLRLEERHGSKVTRAFTLSYTEVGRGLPDSTFALPRLAPGSYRRDDGFVRTGPAAAAAHLAYAPLVPASLPRGFRLAVSGWAPRSATTGPEGSIPPARDLFSAVYRRGIEHLDLTERLAPGPGGWPGDPLGGECQRPHETRVRIGGATGVYSAGPQTTPHLYWRSGKVLFTLAGPFPVRDLVEIARSLRPA